MPRIPSSFRNNLIDRVIRELNPGAEDAIFPRTLEDGAIFVYPGRPSGMEWRQSQMIVQSFTGGAGVIQTQDALVAATGLRYYHAISAFHTDSTSRNMTIEIFDGVNNVSIGDFAVLPQNVHFPITRPIVIGETHRIRARVNAIGGAFSVFLRVYSANQGLGSELPGL